MSAGIKIEPTLLRPSGQQCLYLVLSKTIIPQHKYLKIHLEIHKMSVLGYLNDGILNVCKCGAVTPQENIVFNTKI